MDTPPKMEEIEDESGEGAPFSVVGVGASAGGLEAFTQMLKALPADTGMAFVLVQHLAPSHPSALTEILSRATKMRVSEVQDETTVEPNRVYIIPPAKAMVIERGALQLLPREGPGVHRPIDQFFRSLAEDRGHRAIGVVLSGTASDGTLGLEAIKAEGGITFAQDGTAQQEGMPHSAIDSGCVDLVLPPDEIAREIARIGRHPDASPRVADGQGSVPNLGPFIHLLHHATGVDFAHYKFNTLHRRITRRMLLQKLGGLPEYAEYLRRVPAEVHSLYQDILISVTSFFRNPDAFEALKTIVFPRLVEERSDRDPVRIWTLGCSTGQEAYSLAMAFAEFKEASGISVPLQLFATDLNGAGVDIARAGTYSKDIVQDVSPERLRRFFTEVDGNYRIIKAIRDVCVFSRHNVLSDPPFSRIDLISCRNLLIYMEPVLQQQIMPTLHYSLKPAGWLWLGGSETIGTHQSLFEAEDVKHRIYRKKPGAGPARHHLQPQTAGPPRSRLASQPQQPGSGPQDLTREADRALLAQFAPPGVLVSADYTILKYRGDTGPYLTPSPGTASLSLLKMLREGMLVGVRAALVRAGKERVPVREETLRVRTEHGSRDVAVEVIPLKGDGVSEGGFLVLFLDRESPDAADSVVETPASRTEPRATELDRELAATREYLQSVIEQQEAANEELQSANEEVQSANEELQSVNEELETSKEEIEASNEELATVNDELNNRNLELGRVNNDLVNLLDSVRLAIIILGRDLQIRRFTPRAERLFNLQSSDIGRPLSQIKFALDGLANLDRLMAEVLDTDSPREREVQDPTGRWYSLRLRPYKTAENTIEGIVLILVDVDVMKRAQAFTESIVATVREPLLVLKQDLCVQAASRSFYETFQATREETEGHYLYELGHGQWDLPDLRHLLEEVLPREGHVNDFVMECEFEHVGARTMRLNARRLIQADDQEPLFLLAIEDVTEASAVTRALRESESHFRLVMDSVPQKVFTATPAGDVDYVNPAWISFTGLALEEITGWGWTQFIHPDDLADTTRRWQHSVDTCEPFECEHRFRHADGVYRWHLSRAQAIRDARGVVLRWAGSNTDIDDQEQAAEALRTASAELAEADRRKNEFLAMLAHELRNPLAPMRNAIQVIRLSGANPESIRSASEIMERQTSQMTRLVDDLLDVSRISRGKIALHPARIELASIVNHAVEAALPLFDVMGHRLDVSLPPEPVYLNADPVRLAQVVGNLLNNAGKFTDRGGHISLTVDREGGRAVLRVRDSGLGIAAEQIHRIFDMFTQLDTSLERSTSGIGLGLTLVKELVELHRGTIEVVSAGLGQGSEFVVRLPIAPERPPAMPASGIGDQAATSANRILVVDDNRDSAVSLAMLLQADGKETCVALGAAEAIASAETFRPDVILMDIGLPKMSGYEVARRIREQEGGIRIVMIALTGWGDDDARRRSREAGFSGHLVKPVNYAALMGILAEVLPAGHSSS